MRYPDCHFLADRRPLRENDTRLERNCSAPSITALEFYDQVGLRKCAIDFAVAELEVIVNIGWN